MVMRSHDAHSLAADGRAMNRHRRALLGLLLFNGVSAVAGGLALMTDWIPEQASWVRHTDFPSNYVPGVILMAVVGGSSLIAATALLKHADGWQLASVVAGTIMVFWIIGEVASIRAFHFLQVIYVVTGALVVMWTPSRTDRVPPGDQAPELSSAARAPRSAKR